MCGGGGDLAFFLLLESIFKLVKLAFNYCHFPLVFVNKYFPVASCQHTQAVSESFCQYIITVQSDDVANGFSAICHFNMIQNLFHAENSYLDRILHFV